MNLFVLLYGALASLSLETELEKRAVVMTLEDEIRRATAIISRHTTVPPNAGRRRRKHQIPAIEFQRCKGVAVVTEVGLAAAAGLNMASGLVIRKLDNGTWSAPSSLRYVGARGLAAGFDITDYVLILRTKDAVDKFLKPNCNFGGRFSLSVGAGVTAAGGTIPAMVYAYSRGLFVGLSLELGAFYQSKKVNKLFYGSQVDVPSLLNGQVKAPEKAAPLYKALEGAEKED